MVRVLFYVQSLLGVGHLHRSVRLCEYLRCGGFEVLLANGSIADSAIFGSLARVDLPGVRSADIGFSRLETAGGAHVDEAYRSRRRAMLLECYSDFAPHILIIESYPLSRRAFAFELDALLLRAGEDRVLRICSVRDILVFGGGEKKRASVLAKLAEIDHVWVHSNEDFCPLTLSLPFAGEFSDKLVYSGYIGGDNSMSADSMTEASGDGRIIVSGGGGAAAAWFYENLLPWAAALSEYRWLFLLGDNFPDRDNFMTRSLPPHVEITANSKNFRKLLRGARLSISQAGYNTVMDTLAVGVPSLLHPFCGVDGAETEQPLRAQLLRDKGFAEILPQDLSQLSAPDLKTLIEKTCRLKTPAFTFAEPHALCAQLQTLWRRHAKLA